MRRDDSSHRASALQVPCAATEEAAGANKTPIAVFDFDGTVLDGQSSVSLVLELIRRRIMRVRSALPVAWWGVRYKLHLPHEQVEVRQRVFGHLAHLTEGKVADMVDEIYAEMLAPMMYAQALSLIDRFLASGVHVVIVSASFEPIIAKVAKCLGVAQISTRMEVVNGRYTTRLVNKPVEGAQKPAQLTEYANERFGVGGWRVLAAYGDHHTDIPLLEMAEHPYAVNPDMGLSHTASVRGWVRLKWQGHIGKEQLARISPDSLIADM